MEENASIMASEEEKTIESLSDEESEAPTDEKDKFLKRLPHILSEKYFQNLKIASDNTKISVTCISCSKSCSGSFKSTTNLTRHLSVSFILVKFFKLKKTIFIFRNLIRSNMLNTKRRWKILLKTAD